MAVSTAKNLEGQGSKKTIATYHCPHYLKEAIEKKLQQRRNAEQKTPAASKLKNCATCLFSKLSTSHFFFYFSING
jgi:hypothetical protein